MDLPHQETVKELGYEVYCFSGDRTSATYTKEGISLSIWRVGDKHEAVLESTVKMVTLKVGPISFPHPNFSKFEQQIITLKQLGDNYYEGVI